MKAYVLTFLSNDSGFAFRGLLVLQLTYVLPQTEPYPTSSIFLYLRFSVLIGRNEVIKISDFGTSKTWGGERSTCMSFAGTVAWMAPEVIRNEPCNEKVDIWSFGVCLWELLNCEVPYRVRLYIRLQYFICLAYHFIKNTEHSKMRFAVHVAKSLKIR